MAKSIIESIYNTDRVFYEENINTEDYNVAKKEFCESYENLLKMLNEEQQQLLDDVFFLHENVIGTGYSKKFKDGFILGFKLAEEILKAD